MAVIQLILWGFSEWKVPILAVPTLVLAWQICKFLFLDAFVSPLRKLPGPPRSYFLGNLLDLKRKGFLNATLEWSKKYGGIFAMWPRPDYPVVFLTDLSLVKQVLVTNCYKYYRPSRLRQLIPPLGNSLLTSNGTQHAWQRKMLTPAFRYTHLKEVVPFMKIAADDLVKLWRKLLQDSQKSNADVMVHQDLNRLTLDVIGESAFGYQFKSVLGGETEVTKAFRHVVTDVSFHDDFLTSLPFYKYLPTETNKLKREATKITNDVVMKVIKEKRQEKYSGQVSCRRNLLDIAMDMHDDQTGLTMDDEQLCAQVFTFLVAGHETTSTSMSWTLNELAKYPGIQEKIRKEANKVLGDGSDITWAKLDELQYLSNVIKESLRLHPPASAFGRTPQQHDTLGGYHIPSNSHILIGIEAIQRSEKHWADPEAFKPERFENLTKEQEAMIRSILMPFSYGPRVCIGNKLAMAEMRLVLASLLQNFTFSPVPGFPEVTRKIELATKPYPSLQLRITEIQLEKHC